MKLQDGRAGCLRKTVAILRVIVFSVAALVLISSSMASAQQQSADEQAAWTTEHTYWEYVKALDLENYKKMCHPNFVVWGPSSPKPDRGSLSPTG